MALEKDKDYVLVTGATGNQGNATARLLLEKGFRVRAMTHQPHSPKAALLAAAGAEIVRGNLDDPAVLHSAFVGVKGVFAVQGSREAESKIEEERGKRLAYIAKEQDVPQYIYSSVASAREKSGIPHFEVKGRIEKTIRDLNFPSHTFLRGTFFMESLLDPSMFPEVVSSGKLICPISPHTRVQMVSAEDVAKFAVYSFENPNLMNGVELDLAGDEHTFEEIAKVLSAALHKNIEFASVDMEEFARLRDLSHEVRHNVERIMDWWEAVGWDIDIGGLMLASRNCGIELKTLNEWATSLATKSGVYTSSASGVSS
jgi:uncharacterized protein YbjT (DUF2867 family)